MSRFSLLRTRLHFSFFSVIAVFVLLATASAQDASTGALRGAVVDTTGSRIAGASIALVNDATGFRYAAMSDDEGRFAFELLPPGDYTGRAISAGMSPQVTPKLHVDVGGTAEIEFKLAVAGAKESITISGAPPLVETQPTAVSSLIDNRAITELPLDGRRYTDLALMTPGVTQDPRGLTSGSNGDLAFGGSAASSPAIWWMAPITTTPSLPRPAGAIARPISSRTR